MLKRKTASSMLDYGLLIFAIALVLISMGGYIKRGLMNKYKEAGDTFGHGRQFEGGSTVCQCRHSHPLSGSSQAVVYYYVEVGACQQCTDDLCDKEYTGTNYPGSENKSHDCPWTG